MSEVKRMMMTNLEAVIFDLDGLIIDSEPVQLRAMNMALDHLSISISESEWFTMVGKKTAENLKRLHHQYGLKENVSSLERRKNKAYRELIREHATPMPGLHNAIRTSQEAGLRLALASSSVKEDIRIILEAMELTLLFEVVVSGDEVSVGKPSPEIFLETARRLEIEPRRCVVLEDTAYGVTAAKAAGMQAIAIPNRYTVHQSFGHANLVLGSLSELNIAVLRSLK